MQKKNLTQRIISIVLAIVFAFAPIVFAGCSFDPDDSGSGSGSGGGGGSSSGGGGSSSGGGGGTIVTNYKIGDYLDAVKVSYSVAGLSEDTQNDEIQEYSNQIINLTQMLAVDTIFGLVQQYGMPNSKAGSVKVDTLEKSYGTSNVPYSNGIEQLDVIDNESGVAFEKYKYDENSHDSDNNYFSYVSTIASTTGDKDKWLYFDSSKLIGKITDYLTALGLTQSNSTNLYKITYAILSIVDTFDNVEETDFSSKYMQFRNNYDRMASSSATDWEKECKTLSYNVKHSGLYANSLESKAFKQFILDRVIGENLVNKDNTLFQVYKQKTTGSKPTYDFASPDANEKFRGETFYYNPDAEFVDGEVNDISLYINLNNSYDGDPNCEELSEKLKIVVDGKTSELSTITGTQVKMWQDIDNSGDIEFSNEIGNVVLVRKMNEYGGYENVPYPKYRALPGFRNYDYTVETIVEKVLADTTNKLKVDGVEIQSDTNYPVIANVFSKNYSYTAVEVKGTSNDNSTSCKLPKMAYKSVLLSMKDRTQMDVKNSLGTIYLLLESSAGVKVNVTMYARYYRKDSGFALFGSDTEMSSFYKFPNGSGEVDGPYGVEFTSGGIKEGCLFELEFEDMFKDAKFKSGNTYVENNQIFDYTYTNEDGETNTVPIYEIKPFPKDYAPISNSAGHASIYTGIDYKTKPVYEAQKIGKDTGSLYAYSENNLADYADECEFVELIFVTDNDNPFTFGFTGFIPQTELYH